MDLAKVSPPAASLILARPRLLDLLDANRGKKLVVVCAQPGQGKSILAADYLVGRQRDFAWYNLDTSDASIGTLLEGLSHSLSRSRSLHCIAARVPASMALRSAAESLVRDWIEDNLDCMNEDFYLVLDDCQLASPAVDTLVRVLAAESRRNIHTIALSRSPLDVDAGRLAAMGEGLFLGNDDLRFTWEETQALFERVFASAIADSVLRDVWRLSEGWIFGLVLFNRYLADRSRPADRARLRKFLKDDDSNLFRFFADSVFGSLAAESKKFLVMASLFENIYLPLPKELSAGVNPEDYLEWMRENNLFTFCRGQDSSTYYFHSLFRAFLQSRFSKLLGAGKKVEVARSASRFLRSRRKFREAVDVLLRSKLYAEAAAVIEENGPTIYSQAGPAISARWVEAFPPQLLTDQPWLSFLASQTAKGSDPEAAVAGTRKALELFTRRGDHRGMTLCLANLTEMSSFTNWGQDQMEAVMKKTDRLIGSADLEHYPFRSLLLFTAGLHHFYLGRDLKKGTRALLAAASVNEENGDCRQAVLCLLYASILQLHMGELRRAGEVLAKARALGARGPGDRVSGILCRLIETGLHLFSGRYRVGLRECLAAREALRERGLILLDPIMRSWEFWLRLLSEDPGESFLPSYADDGSVGGNTLHRALVASYRALLAVFRGGPLEAASSDIEQALPLLEKTGAGFYYWNALFAGGVILAGQGQVEEAGRALERTLELCEEGHARQLAVSVRLYLARLSFARGRQAEGVRLLRRALGESREMGCLFFGPFPPGELAELCALAIRRRIESEQAWRVLGTLAPGRIKAPLEELASSGSPAVRGQMVEHLAALPTLGPREALAVLDTLSASGSGETQRRVSSLAESVLSSVHPLRFSLLGAFEFTAWGGRIEHERWRSRKVVSLLKFLCTHFPKNVARELAAEALWPEGAAGAGLLNLRVNLSKLRRLLDAEVGFGGLSAISSTKEYIGLNPQVCRVDLAEFREAYQSAMNLWKGGDRERFMEFAGPALRLSVDRMGDESDPDFLLESRDQVARQEAELLWNASLVEESRSQHAAAIEHVRRIIDRDNLREDAYLRLMQLLASSGNRVEAIKAYHSCRQVLSEELDVEPDGSLRQLFEELARKE